MSYDNIRKGEYHSVGGDATHIIFNFPGYGALYMGSLISLSYQTYRDKVPVYNLGNTNIDGFAIGKRYVAGSIIKAMFLNDDLRAFLNEVSKDIGLNKDIDSIYALKYENSKTYHHLMMDDILPFDIIIVLSSEYGNFSVSEIIYGATLINSGQVHSIQDLIVENTISFVARDARQTLESLNSTKYNITTGSTGKKASELSDKSNTKYKSDKSNTNPDQEWFKNALEKYKKQANLDGQITPDEQKVISTLSQLAGLGEDPNYNWESLPSEYRIYKSDPYTNGSTKKYVYPKSQDIDSSSLTALDKGDKFEVDDGDTLVWNGGVKTSTGSDYKGKFTIRLLGIDTPETEHRDLKPQEYGYKASDFMKEYVKSGKWDQDVRDGVVKIAGTDVYGRTLVYNYNYVLAAVSAGTAHYMDGGVKQIGESEDKRAKLNEAALTAKREKRGLWGTGNTVVMPSIWRKTNKKSG